MGVGGAFLMANSSAILTDAFPADQRGLAMGINGVAAIAATAPLSVTWVWMRAKRRGGFDNRSARASTAIPAAARP